LNYKKFIEKLLEAIKTAEEVITGGVEKKAYVIKLINAKIDIPWVPEVIEAKIIEYSVELVIFIFNQYIGKNWLNKIV